MKSSDKSWTGKTSSWINWISSTLLLQKVISVKWSVKAQDLWRNMFRLRITRSLLFKNWVESLIQNLRLLWSWINADKPLNYPYITKKNSLQFGHRCLVLMICFVKKHLDTNLLEKPLRTGKAILKDHVRFRECFMGCNS